MARQYEMAFAIGAKMQGNFNATFKNASASVKGLQTQIESLNKKQGDITSYQKTQTAIERTQKKLELYQQQYANLKAEMEKNGQASAAEQNALLAKGKAIDDLKEKQAQLEAKLATTGDALQKEGVDLNRLSDASVQTGSQIDQLKQKQVELAEASENSGGRMTKAINDFQSVLASFGVAEGLKKIYDGLKECTEQAIAFEAEMAAVRRTTGGTEEYIKELGEAFKDISTEIPITTSELSSIATTAGQLGIAQEDVERFTVVMAKLATTTDLTADEAATMLAQFSNITGVKDYERIGAVVAQLGDSTATTASKVVEMSQGMAAAANIAGMGSTDIMAIAAALGSLGIEAQAGSTSMSQLITTLYKATETGEKLAEFAEVAGMTADQFKRAWAEDAVGAMNSFITGLNDVERNGRSAIVILSELGITNVRQQKAILGLASAGNLLSSTIAQANTAWEQNTALNEKASIMYETTQAKLTMMNNSFANLGIAIGDAFAPAVGTVADALNGIIQPVTQFIEENPKLVQAIAAAAAVIGVVTAAVVAYTIAAKLAAAASATLSAAMPWLLGLTAGAAIITGLIVGLSDFSDTAKDTTESVVDLKEQYDDLMSGIEEQNRIIDLCEDYKKLSKQIDHTVKIYKDADNFADVNISLSATAEESVTADEFLVDGDHEINVIGNPEGTVDADLLLDEDGNVVTVSGDPEATVDADNLLDNDGKYITVEGVPEASVDADMLLDEQGNVVEIEGNPIGSVDADLLLDGDRGLVEIQGEPGETLLPSSDLVTGEPVTINGEPGETLLKPEELVADGTVAIKGEPGEELLSPEKLLEASKVLLEGEQDPDNLLSPAQLVSPGTVAVQGKPDIYDLVNPDDLVADGLVPVQGTPAEEKLSPDDLVNPGDVEVHGTPGSEETLLDPSELVGDIPVPVYGEAGEDRAVTSADLVEAGAVLVSGEADSDSLVSADELVDNYGIKLYGTPDGNLILDANVLVNNDTPVLIHAEWDNMGAMMDDVEALKQNALDAKTNLTTARTKLRDMLEYQNQLQNRLKYATSQEDKDSLSAQIQILTNNISDQEKEVSKLETSYEEAAGTYIVTASAAETLAERDAELASIQEQLGISASDASGHIDAQTDSIIAQVNAVEDLAKAERDRVRAQLMESIAQKSEDYARTYESAPSSYTFSEASIENQKAINKEIAAVANEYVGKSVEQYNTDLYNLLDSLDTMYSSGQAGTDEFRSALQRLGYMTSFTADMQGGLSSYYKGYEKNYGNPDEEWQWHPYGGYRNAYETGWGYNQYKITDQETLNDRVSRANSAYVYQFELEDEMIARREEYVNDIANAIDVGAISLQEAESIITSTFENAENGAVIVEDTIDQVKQKLADMELARQAAESGVPVSALQLQKATEPIIEQMEELSKAYNEAYDAAYNSISGQFDLFEKMDLAKPADDAHKAVDEYIEALKSQAAYIQQYEANLAAVSEMGLDKALVAQLSDGSKESAEILANIVAGGADKIDQLNSAFTDVETGKESFADTVAEMETDFSTTMDQLEAKLTQTVEEMSKTEEAAAAGADTMQAYADAAAGKQSAVESAFANVAAAAARKLRLTMTLNGFAGGTPSAPEGLAMVGEEGPELVYLHGGERILNAADTQRELDNLSLNAEPVNAIRGTDRGAQYTVEYKPQYNITGAMNANELQAVLDEHDADMRERLEELLDDIENDRTRRQYA